MPKQGVELDLRYVGGGKKALRKISPEIYRPHVTRTLAAAVEVGRKSAAGEFKRNTSAIINSFAVEIRPLQARMFSGMPKTRTASIEFGRRAGGNLLHPGVLRSWMKTAGIDPQEVWGIIRTIRRRGVKGRFFMKAARQRMALQLPILTKQLAKAIEAGFRNAK